MGKRGLKVEMVILNEIPILDTNIIQIKSILITLFWDASMNTKIFLKEKKIYYIKINCIFTKIKRFMTFRINLRTETKIKNSIFVWYSSLF